MSREAEIRMILSESALREATAQAIMGALTPDAQQKIITAAVERLMYDRTSMGSNTLLETIFKEAVTSTARTIAQDIVAKDEALKARLQGLLAAAIQKMMDMDADKLAARMGDAFVDSLRRDR